MLPSIVQDEMLGFDEFTVRIGASNVRVRRCCKKSFLNREAKDVVNQNISPDKCIGWGLLR